MCPQDNSLWQGVDGVNNPCPPGWRVPSAAELDAERLSWSSSDGRGAHASTLRWPVHSGLRNSQTGSIDGRGTEINGLSKVWSSSIGWSYNSQNLVYFHREPSGNAYLQYNERGGGGSVRCLRDDFIAPEVYDLTLDVTVSAGGIVEGQGRYSEGQEARIVARPSLAWIFVGWSGDVGYLNDPSSPNAIVVMPAQSITLIANFEEMPDFQNCGDNIKFTYQGELVVYGTVLRNGRCWLDRDLGASRVCISYADSQCYGHNFQWGRLADGHQVRTSGTTTTLSSSDVPGHGDFITTSSFPDDWRSPQNNSLWQGVSGINNPCPSGWRVPTSAELNAERQSWSPINSEGAFNSSLKWATSGRRAARDGWVQPGGGAGYIWSSSPGQNLYISTVGANMEGNSRANGMKVRCILH